MDLGNGPWYVALMSNRELNESKIFIDTYPELIVMAENACGNYSSPTWTLNVIVGPFDDIRNGFDFKADWNKSKKLNTRIENVKKVFMQHKRDRPLNIWMRGNVPEQPYRFSKNMTITIHDIRHEELKRKH